MPSTSCTANYKMECKVKSVYIKAWTHYINAKHIHYTKVKHIHYSVAKYKHYIKAKYIYYIKAEYIYVVNQLTIS